MSWVTFSIIAPTPGDDAQMFSSWEFAEAGSSPNLDSLGFLKLQYPCGSSCTSAFWGKRGQGKRAVWHFAKAWLCWLPCHHELDMAKQCSGVCKIPVFSQPANCWLGIRLGFWYCLRMEVPTKNLKIEMKAGPPVELDRYASVLEPHRTPKCAFSGIEQSGTNRNLPGHFHTNFSQTRNFLLLPIFQNDLNIVISFDFLFISECA